MDDALTAELRRSVEEVYSRAASEPDPTLCCVAGGTWTLPGLSVPAIMHEMNYGCGTTVHPSDLSGQRPILYIGVGGGLEALQFAYFRRFPGGVIAVDPVGEMRAAAARNLRLAEDQNPWFRSEFVRIVEGSALELPVEDGTAELVAQNCLFNVFARADLARALAEAHRVLTPGGRLSSSDPIATRPIPEALQRNTTLRARCCSGCLTYEQYLDAFAAAGFGQLIVRARRPYRMLLPGEFPELERSLLLESLDLVAIRSATPDGRPRVFTGRHAIFLGPGRHERADGTSFESGVPLPVADGTALELSRRADFLVTAPTYHASGPGCC